MKNLESEIPSMKIDSLGTRAFNCRLCPRMLGKRKVLSLQNGNPNSRILFIAEAPGRHGSELSGIPLQGDKSGENFEKLIENIGWTRNHIFVTNSILCNPVNEIGNNSRPLIHEMKNCSSFLQETLDIVSPEFVVTLGTIALKSLAFIRSHKFVLLENVGKMLDWNGMKLIPLYHPSPRVTASKRSFKQMQQDFNILARNVGNPLKI